MREKIQPEDTLWFLGDLTFGNKAMTEDLVGDLFRITRSFLVKGNHDKRTNGFYKDLGFQEIYPLQASFVHASATGMTRLLLSHYPMTNLDPRYGDRIAAIKTEFDQGKYDLLVHGHSHSRNSPDPRCFNVSVEAHDFYPVPIEKILERVATLTDPARLHL